MAQWFQFSSNRQITCNCPPQHLNNKPLYIWRRPTCIKQYILFKKCNIYIIFIWYVGVGLLLKAEHVDKVLQSSLQNTIGIVNYCIHYVYYLLFTVQYINNIYIKYNWQQPRVYLNWSQTFKPILRFISITVPVGLSVKSYSLNRKPFSLGMYCVCG